MHVHSTVLLLGGTGRTGRHVLQQLLERGVRVRAIARSAARLPADLAEHPALTVIEADLLSLGDAELQRHLSGCVATISCLGHVLDLKGIFGPPRDLVTRATSRVCRGLQALRPDAPVRLVLMSSVSVNRPNGLDARRSPVERALLGVIRGAIPPALDNQRAADFLQDQIGTHDPFVEWVAVRPDTLMEGEVTPYEVHEALVSSLFTPDHTNMANVAHFMCDLVTDRSRWAEWRFKLPVIVNTVAVGAAVEAPA